MTNDAGIHLDIELNLSGVYSLSVPKWAERLADMLFLKYGLSQLSDQSQLVLFWDV